MNSQSSDTANCWPLLPELGLLLDIKVYCLWTLKLQTVSFNLNDSTRHLLVIDLAIVIRASQTTSGGVFHAFFILLFRCQNRGLGFG